MTASNSPIFPGSQWQRRDPGEAGINVDAIERIGDVMQQASAHGVLIHKGYLVADWAFDGDASRRFNIQSCTKAISSAVLGLALMEGRIRDLDAPVVEYFPAFDAGPYSDEITFGHLVTATSGVASRISPNLAWGDDYRKPGEGYRYNSDHHQHLALALTYVFQRDLEDALRDGILQHLHIEDGFEWGRQDGRGGLATSVTLDDGREIPSVAGYFDSRWSARDLARVGYLYLRDGVWNGRRLLPQWYVRQCRQAIDYPITTSREGKPRFLEPGESWTPRVVPASRYGLSWRGFVDEQGVIRWHMNGFGGQFCMLIPEHDLVLVKINDWERGPHMGINHFKAAIADLMA